MQSNDDLGFVSIHPDHSEASMRTDGGQSIALQVGKRDGVYRAYVYLFQHDQDASQEGTIDALAMRDETAEAAIRAVELAVADQWTEEQARAFRHTRMELLDWIAEIPDEE